MEAQEALEKMATGLMNQAAKSEGPRRNDNRVVCRFRGTMGRKCAVGFMIPDSVYNPGMELSAYDELSCFSDWPEETIEIMGAMQCVHDNREPMDWAQGIRRAAIEAGLYCPEAVK